MEMASKKIASVEEYLAAQPETTRVILDRVRRAIRKALPKAEETISYHMPTYRVAGKPVIYFAAWKKHYSLYPVTAEMLTKLDAGEYEVQKGTVRFGYDVPVPAKLIESLARMRAAQTA